MRHFKVLKNLKVVLKVIFKFSNITWIDKKKKFLKFKYYLKIHTSNKRNLIITYVVSFFFTGIDDDVHRFSGNNTHTDYFRLILKDGEFLLVGGR